MLANPKKQSWVAIRRMVLGAQAMIHHTPSGTTINFGKNPSAASKDDYFAAVHNIIHIVKHDFFMERTLNRLSISGGAIDSDLVYRVLRGCQTSGPESLRFFNWARAYHLSYRPTSVEVEELVKTLARSKKYESMWKLLDLMNTKLRLTVSTDTLCFIIEEYGRQGLSDQSVEIFNRAPKIFKLSHTVEVYNSLLFALGEAGLFHGAYSLVRRMIRANVLPNKKTYLVLVNAWCAAGKLKEAQSFLDEMSKNGFKPPVRGRELLIEGMLNAGYMESAKEMTRKMVKEGFSPNVSTFNSLVEAIIKSGNVEFCFDLYKEVCRAGMCPDINTYKLLIPAASKLGRIDEAFRLLNDLTDTGCKPFPSLYAPIIKSMCKAGNFDDASGFFNEMKGRGHPPNRPVYSMLISMFGRKKQFVEAANYLIEMNEKGLVPMSRNFDLITDGLRNSGNHDLAHKLDQIEVSISGLGLRK